jgi:hypothetical protein
MALNYLGSGTGPGTMPSAVPGGGQVSDTLGAIQGRSPIAPQLAAAIQQAVPVSNPGQPGLLPPGPQNILPQYTAVTQEDGSILMHLNKPDGSPGPVVKVISPINAGGKSQSQPQGQ